MTCITHCGEDVNYQRYEFPHGEYLLPLNSDGTIHRCSVLRGGEDDILVIHNEAISEIGQLYGNLLYELQMIYFHISDEYYQPDDDEYKKISEFLTKIFFINHICPDPYLEELPSPYPVVFGAAAVIGFIGLLYKQIGDIQSAEKANSIEKQINLSALMYDSLKHNNSSSDELWKKVGEMRDIVTDEMRLEKIKEIIENIKEKRNHYDSDGYNEIGFDRDGFNKVGYSKNDFNQEGIHEDEDDEKFSLENLEKYAREVECEIKLFLRRRISEPEIKKYYSYCYKQAINDRKNNPGYLKRDFDDLIEYLNFGNALSILNGKIDRKIEDQSIIDEFNNSNLDFHIEGKYFNFLYLIRPFRNDNSHYTQKRGKNSMHLYERQMIYLAYLRSMDFFESSKNI